MVERHGVCCGASQVTELKNSSGTDHGQPRGLFLHFSMRKLEDERKVRCPPTACAGGMRNMSSGVVRWMSTIGFWITMVLFLAVNHSGRLWRQGAKAPRRKHFRAQVNS